MKRLRLTPAERGTLLPKLFITYTEAGHPHNVGNSLTLDQHLKYVKLI